MLFYKQEKQSLFIGSTLPMGDIDAASGEHAAEAVTVRTKGTAEVLLRAMARHFRCPAVIRRTAGGVHVYIMKKLSVTEWAEVHRQFGGDPLYTQFTQRSRWGLWWDRCAPKAGRRVDDDPSDWYTFNPFGVKPDLEMLGLWEVNSRVRELAFTSGIEAAVDFLSSIGAREIEPGADRRLPPPPPPRR